MSFKITQTYLSSAANEESIKVFVRVRPSSSDGGERCVSVSSEQTLELYSKSEPRVFTYDQVVDENATQVTERLKSERKRVGGWGGGGDRL